MYKVSNLYFYVNILWTMIQITLLYVKICIIHVQSFYKVLRLSFRNYGIIIISINKIFLFTNFILVFFKNIKKVDVLTSTSTSTSTLKVKKKNVYKFRKNFYRCLFLKNDNSKKREKGYIESKILKFLTDISILYRIYRLIDKFFSFLIFFSGFILLVFFSNFNLTIKLMVSSLFVLIYLCYVLFLQLLKLKISFQLDTYNNKFFYKNLSIYLLNLSLFYLLIIINFSKLNRTEILLLDYFYYIFCIVVSLIFILFYLISLNFVNLEKNEFLLIDNEKNLIDFWINSTFIRRYLEFYFILYEEFIFFRFIYIYSILKFIIYIITLIYNNNNWLIFFYETLNLNFELLTLNINFYLNFLLLLNFLIYVFIWLISDVLVFIIVLPKCLKFNSPLDGDVLVSRSKNLGKKTLLRRSFLPLFAFMGSYVTFNFVHQMVYPDHKTPIQKMAEYYDLQERLKKNYGYPPDSWRHDYQDDHNNEEKD